MSSKTNPAIKELTSSIALEIECSFEDAIDDLGVDSSRGEILLTIHDKKYLIKITEVAE